jgi:hypothetical protein
MGGYDGVLYFCADGAQEIGLRPAVCEEVDTAQKRRERGIAQDAWARRSGYTLN